MFFIKLLILTLLLLVRNTTQEEEGLLHRIVRQTAEALAINGPEYQGNQQCPDGKVPGNFNGKEYKYEILGRKGYNR